RTCLTSSASGPGRRLSCSRANMASPAPPDFTPPLARQTAGAPRSGCHTIGRYSQRVPRPRVLRAGVLVCSFARCRSLWFVRVRFDVPFSGCLASVSPVCPSLFSAYTARICLHSSNHPCYHSLCLAVLFCHPPLFLPLTSMESALTKKHPGGGASLPPCPLASLPPSRFAYNKQRRPHALSSNIELAPSILS